MESGGESCWWVNTHCTLTGPPRQHDNDQFHFGIGGTKRGAIGIMSWTIKALWPFFLPSSFFLPHKTHTHTTTKNRKNKHSKQANQTTRPRYQPSQQLQHSNDHHDSRRQQPRRLLLITQVLPLKDRTSLHRVHIFILFSAGYRGHSSQTQLCKLHLLGRVRELPEQGTTRPAQATQPDRMNRPGSASSQATLSSSTSTGPTSTPTARPSS